MAKVSYTNTQRAEAVALARVVGALEASRRLRIDIRTVRDWSKAAGVTPEIDPDLLARFEALTLAKAEADVVAGKVHGVNLIRYWGIARDKLDRRSRDQPTSPDLAVLARDAFLDWVAEVAADSETLADADFEAVVSAVQHLPRELLRLANAEPEPRQHRTALLTWWSDRTEAGGNPILAGDLVPWCQAETRRLVEQHGTLVAWHQARIAIDERERADRDALAAHLRAQHAPPIPAPDPGLPPDVLELLAEADQYLEERAQ